MNQYLDKIKSDLIGFKKLSVTAHLSLLIAVLLLITIGITINNSLKTQGKNIHASTNSGDSLAQNLQNRNSYNSQANLTPVTPTIYCLGSCPTVSPTETQTPPPPTLTLPPADTATPTPTNGPAPTTPDLTPGLSISPTPVLCVSTTLTETNSEASRQRSRNPFSWIFQLIRQLMQWLFDFLKQLFGVLPKPTPAPVPTPGITPQPGNPQPTNPQPSNPAPTCEPSPSSAPQPTVALPVSVTPAITATPPPAAISCTQYVAKNGSDSNPGTEASPWLTIQHAANTAVAGNTVCIKAGTYNERLMPKNSGTQGNWITFTSYPQQTATIDGAGINVPDWGGLVHINGKNYIKISDLKIANSRWAGIFVTQSSGITVKKNNIYNTASSAVLMAQGSNYTVDGNSIELAANGGSNFLSQEIISIQYHVNGFEVKNNHIFNSKIVKPLSGGEGIDAKFGASNGAIHHNIVSDVWPVGIYVDAYDAPQSNVTVYDNMVNNAAACLAAAAEQAGGVLDTVKFYNNVCYDNYWGMFIGSDNGTVKNISVINNTFVDNNPSTMSLGFEVGSFEGASETGFVDNVIIRNNIISQNTKFQLAIDPRAGVTNIYADHNLIDGFRGFTNEVNPASNTTYINNNISGSPLFINAAGSDFHLKAGSPAIDKGTATGAPSTDYADISRPKGQGFDIGAYEF